MIITWSNEIGSRIATGSYPTRQQLLVAQDLTIYASLAVSISSTDTTLSLTGNTPAIVPGMVLCIESEKVYVVSASAGSAVVTRAYGGTAATSHGIGVPVRNLVSADYHNILANEIVSLESGAGLPGGVVVTDGSNKIPNAQIPVSIPGPPGVIGGVTTDDGWATGLATDAAGKISLWTYFIEYYPGANFGTGFQAMNVSKGGGSSGTNNTAVGFQAGRYLATPSTGNVFVGYLAGQPMTNGNYNVAIGVTALGNVTTGAHRNVAVGGITLTSPTIGSDNIAIGYNAGQTATNSSNVFIGSNTAVGSTGGSNVCIGYNAANPLSTGTLNTAIGYQAGCSLTGNNNISVGANAVMGNAVAGAVQLGGGTNATSNTFQWKSKKLFDDVGNFYPVVSTPASSSATATAGSLWADANYLYFAPVANTIKRIAWTTF